MVRVARVEFPEKPCPAVASPGSEGVVLLNTTRFEHNCCRDAQAPEIIGGGEMLHRVTFPGVHDASHCFDHFLPHANLRVSVR